MSQPTLLVVDDEVVVRGLVVRVLASAGYAVLEADHGVQALQQAEQFGGSLALVVTDINMPVMDGPEFARRFRALYPATPLLFITGRGGEALDPGLLDSGGQLLRKPFSFEGLLDTVARMLAQPGSPAPPDRGSSVFRTRAGPRRTL